MEITPNHRVRLRELCGLSVRDLADRTGVSKTRLNQWELGRPPELHTNEVRTIRNVLLELSGANHKEVIRLLKVRTTHVGRRGIYTMSTERLDTNDTRDFAR